MVAISLESLRYSWSALKYFLGIHVDTKFSAHEMVWNFLNQVWVSRTQCELDLGVCEVTESTVAGLTPASVGMQSSWVVVWG